MARSRITGMPKLLRALAQASVLAVPALKSAAVEEMETVMAEAKRRTPMDVGTLRRSGVVLPPVLKGKTIEVVAGFGGDAKAYAIPQHERLDYSHTVGEAKFLERPFLERSQKMPIALAASVRLHMERLRA